jgi:hypothetical protein
MMHAELDKYFKAKNMLTSEQVEEGDEHQV